MNHACLVLLALCAALRLTTSAAATPPTGSGTNRLSEQLTLPLRQGKWMPTLVRFDRSGLAPWIDGNCLSFEAQTAGLSPRPAGKTDGVRR